MQFTSTLLVLAAATFAAAMPTANTNALTERSEFYLQGTCQVGAGCTLDDGEVFECDPGAQCPSNGAICTLSSENRPGSGPYATGKAHCGA